MPKSLKLNDLSPPAPSAGVSTGSPARIIRASEALCLKVSSSSLVTCTFTGAPLAFIPSSIAVLTCSNVLPLRICSEGSVSKSRQSAIISVMRLRSAIAASLWFFSGAAGSCACCGAGICCCTSGGAADAPLFPASPLSCALISASACSISRWQLSNCACSSAVRARLLSALAAFTIVCCLSIAASRLCFGVINLYLLYFCLFEAVPQSMSVSFLLASCTLWNCARPPL